MEYVDKLSLHKLLVDFSQNCKGVHYMPYWL